MNGRKVLTIKLLQEIVSRLFSFIIHHFLKAITFQNKPSYNSQKFDF